LSGWARKAADASRKDHPIPKIRQSQAIKLENEKVGRLTN